MKLKDSQIEFIQTYYAKNTCQWIAKRIGISGDMVRYYARRMGLAKNIREVKISDSAKDYIIQHYGQVKACKIAETLGLTLKQVHYYADVMGVSNKRKSFDRELFIQLYPDTTNRELARRFGVTVQTIYRWAQELDLDKKVCYKWSDDDISFVQKWHGLMTHQEMADRLGKTRAQVIYLIRTLQIPKQT